MHSPAIRMGDQVDAWKDDQQNYYRARVVEMESYMAFVHYEGFPHDQACWIGMSNLRLLGGTRRRRLQQQQRSEGADDDARDTSGNYGPRGKESHQSWQDYAAFYYTDDGARARNHTGLVQDGRMALHTCPCHSKKYTHPERPERLSCILSQLHHNRLLRFVKHLHGREATRRELLLAHQFQHVLTYAPEPNDDVAPNPLPLKKTSIAALLNPLPSPTDNHAFPPMPASSSAAKPGMTFHGVDGVATGTISAPSDKKQPAELNCKMACGELGIAADTTYHPVDTAMSAKVAVGSLLNLVDAIVEGRLTNGFALIRPPGHHAEDSGAMGFCFFNNVAVAALSCLERYPNEIKKILIIDWDVHHGNGTQKIFYDNPNVLYISIHRWDKGQFYPFTGSPDECGTGAGLGRNVNISLSDAEDQSPGFDAAEGHPDNLGGYKVTPRGFAIMTKMMVDLAQEVCEGRLVLTLEGGYELQSLAASAAASVTQLLPSWCDHPDYLATYDHALNTIKPNQGCVDSLRQCAEIQRAHWDLPEHTASPSFRFHLPVTWRASKGILTRPKRDKKLIKIPAVEGY
ncbi:hypothetical protein BC940DRAFT_325729 [Gongronella butleri]|nr:hypothetical protein BC940DRAFT_325729 [Gongronella butleri]